MTLAHAALDAVTVGRWQFGITTVYHFILVPLTIGLSLLVAIMQTAWHRTGKEHWLQATRFFGKLLLINFALGVATGIVQEFQFGMNWSEYSRFVGDIFGAPLAVEALLAFFLESTFLGLWIFGWGRLSKGMHLATIWCVAIGTMLSAAWILAANAWMQHPVGARFNPTTGRAELDGMSGFLKLITSGVYLSEYAHVITSAWLVAGSFVAGIALWWMVRTSREGSEEAAAQSRGVWRPIARFGLVVVLIGGLGTVVTGHFQGQEVVKAQPLKMAVAEGVCVDTDGAAFTVAQFGSCPLGDDGAQPTQYLKVPGLASFLAHNSFTARSEGVANAQTRMADLLNADPNFTAKYGDASRYDFRPPQMVTFWSFRLMIGLGMVAFLLAAWGLWATRAGRTSTNKWLGVAALVNLPLPFVAASFGWIFTEIGRQPWVVAPNLDALSMSTDLGSVAMMTDAGISPNVPAWQILATLILFTLLYGVFGIMWYVLMKRYAVEGIHSSKTDRAVDEAPAELSFGY
ncbi:cytochrome BD ubiquinol oxidase subunit I [Schaalia meyeri]|uniref:cytochrome ubiquinol oxidase subunit I n=1 Tax=Schaalia meyeri TaxID=52773 RepID=UPI0006835AE3|nr:cytochrome ubiquinol oxidase subunit I [Schaalia meyeri]AKU64748.1 cytochrome BD ubiquinol oxidase subunit I [Schaalia meyeri]OFQ24460.1 cytochrome BD ubiquinol oxidase subunit I [Actinomyces sp. HMSC062G12]